MKQVNPKYGLRFGQHIDYTRLDDFNDTQITQLYELFQEATKQKRVSDTNKD